MLTWDQRMKDPREQEAYYERKRLRRLRKLAREAQVAERAAARKLEQQVVLVRRAEQEHERKVRAAITADQKRQASEAKKEERRRLSSERYFLKTYGLTNANLDDLSKDQGHACAICRASFDAIPFVVDHCHATMAVRGLLCSPCNKGLGHFGDQPERLEAAAGYLRDARGTTK